MFQSRLPALLTLYEEVNDAVKELSNETQVFCVFAREIVSEYRETDFNLSVLGMFDADRLDMLAFTSYAYAVQGVNMPIDVPNDYFTRASTYMPEKHMVFTELGRSSSEAFGGQQGHANFLKDVEGRLMTENGKDFYMLAWAWPYIIDANDDVGLIEDDGAEKIAYSIWEYLSGGM